MARSKFADGYTKGYAKGRSDAHRELRDGAAVVGEFLLGVLVAVATATASKTPEPVKKADTVCGELWCPLPADHEGPHGFKLEPKPKSWPKAP